MSAKTYGILMRIIAVGLAALIAVSIIQEWSLTVPVAAMMVALNIASIVRRFVKETLADERNRSIFEKAAALAYRIYTIATALFVLIVMMLRSSLPSWVFVAGQTLAYSICGLMLIHLVVTRYYERKL